MSRSDWIAHAAFGLIVACAVAYSLYGPERPGHAYEPQGYAQEQTEPAVDVGTYLLPLEVEVCAEAERAGSADAEQHDKRDLCAQYLNAWAAKRAADAALAQGIIGGLGLLALVITLGLNWIATNAAIGAAKAANDQAETARRALDEVERPYLGIEITDHGTKTAFWGPRISGPIKFVFHNHGRTPARLHLLNRRYHVRGTDDEFIDAGELYARGKSLLLFPEGVIIPPGRASDPIQCTAGEFIDMDALEQFGSYTWYFAGYLIYRDMGLQEFVLGFCLRLDTQTGRFALTNPEIDSGKNPDEYNYTYRLEPDWFARISPLDGRPPRPKRA